MNKLIEFETTWGVNKDNPHKVSDVHKILNYINDIVNINTSSTITEIQSKYEEYISNLTSIHHELKCSNKSTDYEIIIRVNRLLEMTYYAKTLSIGMCRVTELMDLNNDYRDNNDTNLFRFSALDHSKNNNFQNFLLFLLDHFYEHQYARYQNDIYKMIMTDSNLTTYAWKRVESITNVIYSTIKKEVNYDQFINATSSGNIVRQSAEFLSQCQDSQFPELVKNRRVFSFTNGIYFAKSDKFIEYNDINIPKNTISSKYFDIPFDNRDEEWNDISTPYFDSIFHHQGINGDILKWVYIFTGRLIYEIDEMDGWQVIFFVQGQAGTGKSTYIMNVCKQLYDEEDVGVMSNNIQTKFGLADLVDKLLYVAPEIKRDFSIEQGEFQSIVSGDKVTINIKCKSSRFENWKIPGVMAGNESPDFIDNSGSIQRRMVSIKFNNRVHDGDLLLGSKIQSEMPHIIKKCNKVYLEYANKYGRSNIWTVLPTYFANTRAEIAKSTNSLIHYLSSDRIVLDADKYIPEKVFVQYFNQHCTDNNYKRSRFNPDFYSGPFSQFNIKIQHCKKKYFGKTMDSTFFIGVDIKQDDDNNISEFDDL